MTLLLAAGIDAGQKLLDVGVAPAGYEDMRAALNPVKGGLVGAARKLVVMANAMIKNDKILTIKTVAGCTLTPVPE